MEIKQRLIVKSLGCWGFNINLMMSLLACLERLKIINLILQVGLGIVKLDDFFSDREEMDRFIRDAVERIDGTAYKNLARKLIEDASCFVEREYPGRVVPEEPIYYDQGRAGRCFEFELNRLWRKAVGLYVKNKVELSLPIIRDKLGDKTAYDRIEKYNDACVVLLERHIVPLLRENSNAGEDAFIFVGAMMQGDDDYVRKGFLETNLAPSQLEYSYIAMLGLLLCAKKAHLDNKFDQAYSYLIDAGSLIGMHDGSAFVTSRLDAIIKSRRAQDSAHAKHERYKKTASRVVELFYTLKPKDKALWRSAAAARTAIMKVLDREAFEANLDGPGIAPSSVYSICKELCNKDLEVGSIKSQALRAMLRVKIPDGSIVDVPIGHMD